MKWYNKTLKIFYSGPSNKFVLPEIPLRLLMQYWGYVIPDWLDFWIVPFELWIVPFFALIGALTASKWPWTTFQFFVVNILWLFTLIKLISKICWECQRGEGWLFDFVQSYGRDLLRKWKQKLRKILNKMNSLSFSG